MHFLPDQYTGKVHETSRVEKLQKLLTSLRFADAVDIVLFHDYRMMWVEPIFPVGPNFNSIVLNLSRP